MNVRFSTCLSFGLDEPHKKPPCCFMTPLKTSPQSYFYYLAVFHQCYTSVLVLPEICIFLHIVLGQNHLLKSAIDILKCLFTPF